MHQETASVCGTIVNDVSGKHADSLNSNDTFITREKSTNDPFCIIKAQLSKNCMKKKSTKRYKRFKSKKMTLVEIQSKEDESFLNPSGIYFIYVTIDSFMI